MGNGSSVNTTIKRGEEKRKGGGGEIVAVAASSTVCFNSIRFDIRVVSCHCVARR